MRIEIEEANSNQNQFIGSKRDQAFVRVYDADFSKPVTAEVYDIDLNGSLFRVAGNADGVDGPPMHFDFVSESDGSKLYRLTLLYVSLGGHLIRCRCGDDHADTLIWAGTPYEIRDGYMGREGWHVLDHAKEMPPTTLPDDDGFYFFDHYGIMGPFPSKDTAMMMLLISAAEGLKGALIGTSDPDEVLFRSNRVTDSIFVIKTDKMNS